MKPFFHWLAVEEAKAVQSWKADPEGKSVTWTDNLTIVFLAICFALGILMLWLGGK